MSAADAPHPGVRAVTVYCASSNDVHEHYRQEARRLGAELARAKMTLVYGGGAVGLMGELSRACRDAGGCAVGIITERLRDAEQMDPDNHENVVVGTMRQRKALLESRCDAMVVLPGGLGTLEEFFEVLVGRLLGEHAKPIFILNSNDPDAPGRYYDPLLGMFDHMIASRFARAGVRTLFEVCNSVDDVMAGLRAHARRHRGEPAPDHSNLMPTPPPGR